MPIAEANVVRDAVATVVRIDVAGGGTTPGPKNRHADHESRHCIAGLLGNTSAIEIRQGHRVKASDIQGREFGDVVHWEALHVLLRFA